MAAPLGNKFWLARSSHGRNPIFKNPDDLWTAACEYFEWVQANPLYEDKVNFHQGQAVHEAIPKMRAMTIQALTFFLDISDETWANYCSNKDFIGITTQIKKVIYSQKFEGAAADLLNSNIIARELGLSEKQQLDHTSSDGTMSPKTAKTMTQDEIKAELEALGVKL
ncbi:MAG TPA: DNA-packaging protein [Agitococcus sp.]|nr:DNA-packaging protein [Agitococcus sp.]